MVLQWLDSMHCRRCTTDLRAYCQYWLLVSSHRTERLLKNETVDIKLLLVVLCLSLEQIRCCF
jgi:hypothetical protein